MKKARLIMTVVALALISVMVFMFVGCGNGKITQENADKITVGMTYDEVKAILGEETMKQSDTYVWSTMSEEEMKKMGEEVMSALGEYAKAPNDKAAAQKCIDILKKSLDKTKKMAAIQVEIKDNKVVKAAEFEKTSEEEIEAIQKQIDELTEMLKEL